MTDPVEEVVHHIAAGIIQAEVSHSAPPGNGHSFEQVAVDGGSHAETKDPGFSDQAMNRPQYLRLVADVSVSQEGNKTKPFGIMREI